MVSTLFEFRPPLRMAIIFHTLAIMVLAAVTLLGFGKAFQAAVGPVFLFYLIVAMAAVGLIPIFIYRFYALRHASYVLERDGLHLWWGLRGEDIPMDKVLWVRSAESLGYRLPRPFLYWPGCVLGERRLAEAGKVEYMAAQTKDLILVGTEGRIYAISPKNPKEFLQTFQRLTELGSLSPVRANSIYSSFLLARFWSDLTARYMLIAGLALSLVLLVWSGLSVPGREQVALRLSASGAAISYVPSVQLLLLPILNGLFLGVDFFGGLFFYRKAESQVYAYALWGSGVITSLLFLMAVFFILKAG
jgi:hypothetical protein